MADDEGSNKEGGKGDGNGDEGGGRATATMMKKRVRAARVMVTRVVSDEEGDGDGGNMSRNNEDGLVPVVVQQAVLYSAFASLDNVGDDESTGRRLAYALRTPHGRRWRRPNTRTMTATSSCCPLILRRPLFLLSLTLPWGRNS